MEENAWTTGLITSASVQMDSVGGTANKVSSLIAGCWKHLGVYWRFIRICATLRWVASQYCYQAGKRKKPLDTQNKDARVTTIKYLVFD